MILAIFCSFELSGAVVKVGNQMEGIEEKNSLQAILEASKKAVVQGSMDVLQVK